MQLAPLETEDPLASVLELLRVVKPHAEWDDISYRRILDALPVAIYTTDAAGRIDYFNREAARLAGRTPEIGVDRWCVTWKLYAPDGSRLPHDRCPMAVAIRENRPIRGAEAIGERPDGSRFSFTPFPTPLHDGSGRLVGAVNMLLDTSEHKATEQRLNELALTDRLTGLPNRAALALQLAELVDPSDAGAAFAMILLDVDNLTEINDGFGRLAGDDMLRAVGRRLDSMGQKLRWRAGGDEFVLIVPGEATDATLVGMIEHLVGAVRQDILGGNHVFQVGLTAGISRYPGDAANDVDLVANVNSALRRAKRAGAGSVRFFRAHTDRQLNGNRLLKEDLRDAIGTEALTLHFQPQAEPGGKVVGFEALVRWTHPVHGDIPPDRFIPLSEESGLIIRLSRWILRAACAAAASWAPHLTVSVNLSPVQFQQEDLPTLVRTILAETGLPAGRLMLEVTEGVLIADYAKAMTILGELAELGVGIALDDFGKGYSSLSYLQEFPFSEIKIDRSFTANLGISPRSDAIVRSVIDLGHALDLKVVVEGVETLDQLAILERTHCDRVQGYLIGRPNPIATFAAITGLAIM